MLSAVHGGTMRKAAIIYLMQIFVFFVASLSSVSAETIVLKTGEKMTGKIFEKSENYLKVDVEGIPITLWQDAIDHIEEEAPSKEAPSPPAIKKTMEPIPGSIETQEEGAPSLVEKTVKPTPESNEAQGSVAERYYRDKQYEKALEVAQEIIKTAPDNPDSLIFLALIYARLGRFEDSALSFEKVLKLKPDDPGNYFCLGVIYDSLGKSGKAKNMLQKASNKFEESSNLSDAFLADMYLKKTGR